MLNQFQNPLALIGRLLLALMFVLAAFGAGALSLDARRGH